MKHFTTLTTSKTTRSESLFKLLRLCEEFYTDFMDNPTPENGQRYIDGMAELERKTTRKRVYFKK
jgi:hypothetical protein